jgi:hypothetical protein
VKQISQRLSSSSSSKDSTGCALRAAIRRTIVTNSVIGAFSALGRTNKIALAARKATSAAENLASGDQAGLAATIAANEVCKGASPAGTNGSGAPAAADLDSLDR